MKELRLLFLRHTFLGLFRQGGKVVLIDENKASILWPLCGWVTSLLAGILLVCLSEVLPWNVALGLTVVACDFLSGLHTPRAFSRLLGPSASYLLMARTTILFLLLHGFSPMDAALLLFVATPYCEMLASQLPTAFLSPGVQRPVLQSAGFVLGIVPPSVFFLARHFGWVPAELAESLGLTLLMGDSPGWQTAVFAPCVPFYLLYLYIRVRERGEKSLWQYVAFELLFLSFLLLFVLRG